MGVNYKKNTLCIILNVFFCSSADVRINVKDVNEYIPEWSQEEYSGQVEEDRMADFILQVTAKDKDCSPTFGEICQYSITSPDQPFQINQEGVISNSLALSATESRSHVLSVVATDCGGKESSPVLVTITVLPKCSTSWSGTMYKLIRHFSWFHDTHLLM